MLKTFIGSSGVNEGLIDLPFIWIDINCFLSFLFLSKENQLFKYFGLMPHLWSTP
jgi:hypothetical protein